ncbi:MAG: SsrA-binding protein SmpB [bacterium]|nr:SsrA-binding protein SmpB [bacterium]MDZ4284561.1 SsrA-binding protein SmpB [Patescibacteria group bacterium]
MPQLLTNKKRLTDLDVLETLAAGIELLGHEVKALRTGMGSLSAAHAIVRGGEAFLVNMSIPPYQSANTPAGYDPERPRKLLLRQQEIAHLAGYERQKGLTIIPISVYTSRRKIKISLAIGRGRKKHDKREVLKKRDAERDMRRTVKSSSR